MFLKIQFLVYAVLLFAGALAFELDLFDTVTRSVDPEMVQKVLIDKELAIDKIIAEMRSDVEAGDVFVKDNGIWMYDRDIDHIKDQEFAVFIYEDDTLRYWTDNSITLHRLYSCTGINNTVMRLDNGWYEIRTVKAYFSKYFTNRHHNNHHHQNPHRGHRHHNHQLYPHSHHRKLGFLHLIRKIFGLCLLY